VRNVKRFVSLEVARVWEASRVLWQQAIPRDSQFLRHLCTGDHFDEKGVWFGERCSTRNVRHGHRVWEGERGNGQEMVGCLLPIAKSLINYQKERSYRLN
jgi:hypothetical protein